MSAPVLTTHEALSGIFGFISLSCWTVILIPQFISNYRNKSADGVSLAFLYLWLFGNVCSFVGGWWAGVVPTILINAIYNCAGELALIVQCLYYQRAKKPVIEIINEKGFEEEITVVEILLDEDRETEPLLPRAQPIDVRSNKMNPWTKRLLTIIGVCVAGTALWATLYQLGLWEPNPVQTQTASTPNKTGPQVLGYLSAVIFLAARIPQIIKNHQKRSCEGLSILFFILSVAGNITYSSSILCHSTAAQELGKSMPWLLGSLGTFGEDFFILFQFYRYRDVKKVAAVAVAIAPSEDNV